MPRWRKGEAAIEGMIERGHLQQVAADNEMPNALVAASERHVKSAAKLIDTDPEGAYSLAYDAARKAAAALLAHQGLRPTTAGGHLAVVESTGAQFPGVAGLKSLDRLRRRRNQAEYPDPAGSDPITSEEAREAIGVAEATISAARRLLDAPQFGVF